MSLKFGIYLVEQRVVTPEQFCGLIKIQQESVQTLAKIALQRNMLTIRQVANILDAQEAQAQKPFHYLAIEMGYLSAAEAERLVKTQEGSAVSIRHLVTECGLLTQEQCRVLFGHFEKSAFQAVQRQEAGTPQPAATTQVRETPPATTKPAQPGLRQPNFKRRPIITQKHQAQI